MIDNVGREKAAMREKRTIYMVMIVILSLRRPACSPWYFY
jgi:hypothetical protein